jgi:serine/threonine protein phosphatase PrpC
MSFVRRLMGRDQDQSDDATASSLTEVQSEGSSVAGEKGEPRGSREPGQDPGADPKAEEPLSVTEPALRDNPMTRASTKISRPPGLWVGYASDVGQVRDHNEDTAIIYQAVQLGDDESDAFGFFIVADGMGGHEAGEVASSLAARLVSRHILERVYVPYLLNKTPDASMAPPTEILRAAVQQANDQVHERVPGAGTTLTCALILGRRAFIAHVGDSRAYLLTRYDMHQLTHDHSYVGRLMELGELSPEEAAVHPQRHVLYRAIGQGDGLDIDTYHQPLPPGSRLLICSDGLSGTVPEKEIGRIIASAVTPQAACDQLLSAATEAGGPDNITAVLIETPLK